MPPAAARPGSPSRSVRLMDVWRGPKVDIQVFHFYTDGVCGNIDRLKRNANNDLAADREPYIPKSI